jgi:hypothetical protein
MAFDAFQLGKLFPLQRLVKALIADPQGDFALEVSRACSLKVEFGYFDQRFGKSSVAQLAAQDPLHTSPLMSRSGPQCSIALYSFFLEVLRRKNTEAECVRPPDGGRIAEGTPSRAPRPSRPTELARLLKDWSPAAKTRIVGGDDAAAGTRWLAAHAP